jgi:hypothetical protein
MARWEVRHHLSPHTARGFKKEQTKMHVSPMVVGKALLTPRVKHWSEHGFRAEIVIDDNALGDIAISEFFVTREEANRAALREMLTAAERYVTA